LFNPTLFPPAPVSLTGIGVGGGGRGEGKGGKGREGEESLSTTTTDYLLPSLDRPICIKKPNAGGRENGERKKEKKRMTLFSFWKYLFLSTLHHIPPHPD